MTTPDVEIAIVPTDEPFFMIVIVYVEAGLEPDEVFMYVADDKLPGIVTVSPLGGVQANKTSLAVGAEARIEKPKKIGRAHV